MLRRHLHHPLTARLLLQLAQRPEHPMFLTSVALLARIARVYCMHMYRSLQLGYHGSRKLENFLVILLGRKPSQLSYSQLPSLRYTRSGCHEGMSSPGETSCDDIWLSQKNHLRSHLEIFGQLFLKALAGCLREIKALGCLAYWSTKESSRKVSPDSLS